MIGGIAEIACIFAAAEAEHHEEHLKQDERSAEYGTDGVDSPERTHSHKVNKRFKEGHRSGAGKSLDRQPDTVYPFSSSFSSGEKEEETYGGSDTMHSPFWYNATTLVDTQKLTHQNNGLRY